MIRDKDHFRAALAFAKASAPETRRSFKHCLSILNRIKRNDARRIGSKVDIRLAPDWVAHSFFFELVSEGRSLLHGGMILHGFEETFAVSLVGKSMPYWAIHT